MCGLTGILDLTRSTPAASLARTATAMAATLTHRGPDEGGVWVDETAGIALAHRRLSIVDLSPAGRQPMHSACGRTVAAYNGEIYNAPELRAALDAAHPWRGHSDTEVLIEAITAWGLARAIDASVGMFALAVFDRQSRTLSLVRDRLGKKPLYYTTQNGLFLFGSQLSALRAHPAFSPAIDRNALAGFIRRGHVLHPDTIYENVHQLEPGHILTVTPDGTTRSAPYWTLQTRIRAARATPFTSTPQDATTALETLLTKAVAARMVADVPLGAFLSGGYDSATVTALMQSLSPTPVRTYCIGFDNPAYDEAPFARAVASHLGTDHTEFRVTAAEARDVIPLLPEIYDEPFADASQIPTYLVAKRARQSVTVALTGDGGDELFAGYNRYNQGDSLRRKTRHLPASARRALAAALLATKPATLDKLASFIPARHRPQAFGEKLHKLADTLALDDTQAYRRLTSQWPDPNAIIIGATERIWPELDPALAALLPNPIERMQVYDTLGYLPADVLTKVDRATMAVSLEARAPLLDHRVAEFAWSLPLDLKIHNGDAKWLLRQVLYRHVPKALVDRPKSGFGIPLGDWLRTDLRDWAEHLLDESTLTASGYLNPAPIRALWASHLSGTRNAQYALWNVLMFEAWRRTHHP